MRINWLFFLSFTLFVLGACSSVQPIQNKTEVASAWRAANVHDQQGFNSTGRLAIQKENKGSYANFSWKDEGVVQYIEIKTPLGNSLGVLCRDAQGVIAKNSHNQVIQSDSIEHLSQEISGLSLPFDYLNQWVRGYWIADEPYELTPDGGLRQAGWFIQRHMRSDGTIPKSVELSNTQLKIKLIFDEYALINIQTIKQTSCDLRNR